VPSVSCRDDPLVVHHTIATARNHCRWCVVPLCTSSGSRVFSERKGAPLGAIAPSFGRGSRFGGSCSRKRQFAPQDSIFSLRDVAYLERGLRYASFGVFGGLTSEKSSDWRPRQSHVTRPPCTATVNYGSRAAHKMYQQSKKSRTQKFDIVFQCRI
jgi:hypothetical protein